jgi:hypothetical protein
MNITQGSLTLIGLNTPTPQVFWNGRLVPGIVGVRVDWDAEEHRVKLKVNASAYDLYVEMAEAGITVKQERSHV